MSKSRTFVKKKKVKRDPSVKIWPVVELWYFAEQCVDGHDRWKAALGSSFGHQAGWFIFTPGMNRH